jgi:AcrR family transcriptional regulator
MARPEIKDERRDQILDAFEICVSRYGVAGATLAKTAEIAGLARPLVRHNVGNREDLLTALIERVLQQSRDSMAAIRSSLPAEYPSQTLIDWLFDPQYANTQSVQVFAALIAASADDAELALQMKVWTEEFLASVKSILKEEFPNAEPSILEAVTAGITGIYFNVESLYPVGGISQLASASKHAAILLLKSLEERS